MAQIIIAPSKERPLYKAVFLAGGIANCGNWQNDVIDYLQNSDITIFNPRRENFDDYAENQIKWEFEHLEQCDIFSIYFCNSSSVQPICMYELGRNIVRMQQRFPNDYQNRIIVSVESGYLREEDVIIQTNFACPNIFVNINATPLSHAEIIRQKGENQ